MKFKNAIFVDQKFMETVAKCNAYEDWEPKGAYWFNRLVKKLRSAFSTAIGELLEEEFEIDGITPIKFPTGLKLSPVEMGLMEEVVDMSAFLDDDEDE